jgi:hypothetical protein
MGADKIYCLNLSQSASHQGESKGPLVWRMTILMATLLFVFIWVVPSVASDDDACISCHGNYDGIHSSYGHTTQPGLIGSVTLFSDNQHDPAGWNGPKPYFNVAVNCSNCHTNNLTMIHGNNCATCHPDPYDSLQNNWNGTCQQGGCHTTYHDDAIKAHLPFEDISDQNNDCLKCHQSYSDFTVPQNNCLNCHATYTSDTTPPETFTDAQSIYEGGAKFRFQIMDNGKVGIGTTFYKLDNDSVTAGSGITLNSPGRHTVEFWSVDQAGNVESPTKTVSFQIFSDTTPPITTSNANAGGTYFQGALITLTATDNSPTGVKYTYYKVNDGPTQTGQYVSIPALQGTFNYKLTFWSEDFGYNFESENTVNFTVISGDSSIRLVWADSDQANPVNLPQFGDTASWTIRIGGPQGAIFRQGSASYPWSGVNSYNTPIRDEPYHVRVFWEAYDSWDESGYNDYYVYVTAPGQLFRLEYTE